MAQASLPSRSGRRFWAGGWLGINVRTSLRRMCGFAMDRPGMRWVESSLAATERLTLARAHALRAATVPDVRSSVSVVHRERELETIDGPIKLHEAACDCPACRRAFFPQRPALGLDQRAIVPPCWTRSSRQCGTRRARPEDVEETGGDFDQRSRDHGPQRHDRARVGRTSPAAATAMPDKPCGPVMLSAPCGGCVRGWRSDYDASDRGTRCASRLGKKRKTAA